MVRARLRFLFVVILAVTANLVTASREVLQAQDICGVSGRCDVELFYDTPTGGLTLDFHRPATVVELQSATGIFGGERPAELTGTFDAFDAHKLFAIRPEGWSGVVEFGPALLPPVLLLFYVYASEWLGFVPAAFAIVLAMAKTLGAGWKLALPLALIVPVVVHFLFAKALRVPLPVGFAPMPW